jgi:hypothetical protein
MSQHNYFTNATVSTTNFADCKLSWTFISAGMLILNESQVIVQYSFNGTDVHGDLSPQYFIGVSFDNRFESNIYFRLANPGSAAVRFETWEG